MISLAVKPTLLNHLEGFKIFQLTFHGIHLLYLGSRRTHITQVDQRVDIGLFTFHFHVYITIVQVSHKAREVVLHGGSLGPEAVGHTLHFSFNGYVIVTDQIIC